MVPGLPPSWTARTAAEANSRPTLSAASRAEEASGEHSYARSPGGGIFHGTVDFASDQRGHQEAVRRTLLYLGGVALAGRLSEVEYAETRATGDAT